MYIYMYIIPLSMIYHSGRNLSCEKAIQLAYGRSVVLPRFPLVPEIMLGGAPGVFLHKQSLKKVDEKISAGRSRIARLERTVAHVRRRL
jgi:hypothetical protein